MSDGVYHPRRCPNCKNSDGFIELLRADGIPHLAKCTHTGTMLIFAEQWTEGSFSRPTQERLQPQPTTIDPRELQPVTDEEYAMLLAPLQEKLNRLAAMSIAEFGAHCRNAPRKPAASDKPHRAAFQIILGGKA